MCLYAVTRAHLVQFNLCARKAVYLHIVLLQWQEEKEKAKESERLVSKLYVFIAIIIINTINN